MTLEGKGAVVTGGGRGIGEAVARSLAEAGASVVVSARTASEIDAVARTLTKAGHSTWAVPCDVADPESIAALYTRAVDHLGQVDILVSNAGVADSAPLPKITLEAWNRVMAVNATGTFLCTQAFLPAMAERGWGRVVNVASVAGKAGAPYIAAYSASKHAVVGFTRSVGAEVATTGVTVNAVCPGYVDTAMSDYSVSRIVEKTSIEEDKARKMLEKMSPQQRMMEAEEVAYLVVSLCDQRAKGVNAQTIVLDGGGVQG